MPTTSRITVEDLIGRLSQLQGKASVQSVFGEPFQAGGRTIIPVANVRYMFGLGMGRGTGKKEGSGEGGGGGGGVTVRPVALLEITDKETTVKPIPDVTRLALMGMALVAWNVFWITYTIRKAAQKR
jgi:uncharacterized spore protein YtfJ